MIDVSSVYHKGERRQRAGDRNNEGGDEWHCPLKTVVARDGK
jgi:hypothetical protein